MTVKSLKDEDKLPLTEIVKLVHKKMDDILRVVDALNLGRTEVKSDGVYRTFNNGNMVRVAVGDFRRKRISSKKIKLF
ncbi:hypothetical protein [Pedobacter xixiisoli]|uniref:Uncharacterized protein n=1 Tax=Pedobacter xixiisoli TaxID=1476464 RepID=A0A286AA46_9SPHI|nr:hypothetical protein [Pedobacter xixiisoli]SOD18786.1 hypothetical protein SAMN06297358_3185 [Pedobacter xixiisoli]